LRPDPLVQTQSARSPKPPGPSSACCWNR
jgi:hypothetical protein